MQPFNRLFGQMRASKDASDKDSLKRELIEREAQIGGKLFGSVPIGNKREFFCLDDHTWIWSESWKDENGKQTLTTRYEIRGNTVMKVQNGVYHQLSLREKKHLKRAIELYYQQVMQSMYPQYVGKAIAQ